MNLRTRVLGVTFTLCVFVVRPSSGYCPTGWISTISPMFCYYVSPISDSVTYENASLKCAQLGANVTYVDSDAENTKLYLAGPVGVDPNSDFWISYKKYPGGIWRWPTGNQGSYLTGWDYGEPDGDGTCVKQTPWHGGKWRDWPCTGQLPYTCKKLAECGQPSLVPNAARVIVGTTTNNITYSPGTAVTYTCTEGYEFSDTSTTQTVTCPYGGGSWTLAVSSKLSSIGDCVIKKCQAAPSFLKAASNGTNGTASLGTVVAYNCIAGYWFDPYSMGMTRYMTCSNSKLWVGSAADCQKSYCIRPITGHARCDNPLSTVGTVATYTCDKGYQFARDKSQMQVFTCTSTTWSPAPDQCQIIRCPDMPVAYTLPQTPSGSPLNSSYYVYDATVVFKCMNGYKYADTTVTQSSYCTENGNWTVNITDGCYPIQCLDPPPNITNTNMDGINTRYFYNNSVKYTCVGSMLFSDGAKSRNATCSKDALWVPTVVGVCIDAMITIQPTHYHVPVAAESADVFGGVAVIILSAIGVTIIVLDLLTIGKHLEKMKKNLNWGKSDEAQVLLDQQVPNASPKDVDV